MGREGHIFVQSSKSSYKYFDFPFLSLQNVPISSIVWVVPTYDPCWEERSLPISGTSWTVFFYPSSHYGSFSMKAECPPLGSQRTQSTPIFYHLFHCNEVSCLCLCFTHWRVRFLETETSSFSLVYLQSLTQSFQYVFTELSWTELLTSFLSKLPVFRRMGLGERRHSVLTGQIHWGSKRWQITIGNQITIVSEFPPRYLGCLKCPLPQSFFFPCKVPRPSWSKMIFWRNL